MIRVGTILSEVYEIQRFINVGRLSILVEAKDHSSMRQVAIKLLHPDLAGEHSAVKRSLREARALMKLQSHNVCRVFEVGVLDNVVPYIVMEYLVGQPLADLLASQSREGEQWPVGESIDLMLQACEALAEAHSHGLVHRDIKPDNLFIVTGENGERVLKVIDFGIAKSLIAHEASLTNDGDVLGTPAYMPPEQMSSSKTVDERADVWSLGVVLYELIAGRQPFVGTNPIEYYRQVTGAPTPPIERPLPDGLGNVLMRCLQKQADKRYRNMAQLVSALVPYASDPERAEDTAVAVRAQLGIVGSGTLGVAFVEQTEPIAT